MWRSFFLSVVVILVSEAVFSFSVHAGPEHHRVVVLTDMGADPDDEQSLVRLLLYANDIDIEGLVATTSCWSQTSIRTDFIYSILDAYEKVHPNLMKHSSDYPPAAALRSIVKEGIPKYGMSGVGEGMDVEGSDWIIEVLEREDERPLWVSVWGGANVLAQALHKMKATMSVERLSRLVSKLRVYTISDQDDAAMWIRREFPDLFYIVSPGDDYGPATWLAVKNVYDGIDNYNVSNEWIANNIQQGHGPLGAAYPDVTWGMEGDTPAFLGLIPNGLNVPEHPNWGGWGGRYELYKPSFEGVKDGGSIVVPEPETRPIWTNAVDSYTPYIKGEYDRAWVKGERTFTSNYVSLWRWRNAFQNDFASRMDWCTMSFEEANHAPVVHLNHPDRITVKSGQWFQLDAYGGSDPDGDSISYLWYHYPEAGTFDSFIEHSGAENFDRVNYRAPEVSESVTAHIVLRVKDKGSPSLTSYKRVIVTIEP